MAVTRTNCLTAAGSKRKHEEPSKLLIRALGPSSLNRMTKRRKLGDSSPIKTETKTKPLWKRVNYCTPASGTKDWIRDLITEDLRPKMMHDDDRYGIKMYKRRWAALQEGANTCLPPSYEVGDFDYTFKQWLAIREARNQARALPAGKVRDLITRVVRDRKIWDDLEGGLPTYRYRFRQLNQDEAEEEEGYDNNFEKWFFIKMVKKWS